MCCQCCFSRDRVVCIGGGEGTIFGRAAPDGGIDVARLASPFRGVNRRRQHNHKCQEEHKGVRESPSSHSDQQPGGEETEEPRERRFCFWDLPDAGKKNSRRFSGSGLPSVATCKEDQRRRGTPHTWKGRCHSPRERRRESER